MATKRKPYIREVKSDWWKQNPYYRFYMLREGTAVFAIWVSLILLVLLASPAAYARIVTNPVVVVLNMVALAASVLHTKTWFELTPKALHLSEEKMDQMVRWLWAASIGVTTFVLTLSFI